MANNLHLIAYLNTKTSYYTKHCKDLNLFNIPHRFHFNGQEGDEEIFKGVFTAEYWEYDSRLGRRWNTDKVVYVWQSVYACFNNNPIFFIDPNGDEPTPDGKPIEKSKSPTPWKVGMEQSTLSLPLKEVVINATRVIRNSTIPFEMRVGMEIYKGMDWLGGRWGIMFTQSVGGGEVDNGERRKARPNMVINQIPIEAMWATSAVMPSLISGSTKTISPEAPRTPELTDGIATAYENKDKEAIDPNAVSSRISNEIHGQREIVKVGYHQYTLYGKTYYYRDSLNSKKQAVTAVELEKKQYNRETK